MNLTDKIFRNKIDVICFHIDNLSSINSGKFIRRALGNLEVTPDYKSLMKKDSHKYVDIHSLIDIIIPIAAGSTSSDVQLLLLEDR